LNRLSDLGATAPNFRLASAKVAAALRRIDRGVDGDTTKPSWVAVPVESTKIPRISGFWSDDRVVGTVREDKVAPASVFPIVH